jgi:hypothetical protein
VAAVAGVLAWLTARAILMAIGPEGFVANAVAVTAGGAVVLAVTLLPPPVRRALRR